MSLNACSGDTQSWDEEVKLLDGRVIVVTQKRLLQNGLLTRDAWLTMKLPEFSAEAIAWHEALRPMILNVFNGKLYIVAYPPTTRENDRYGNPKSPYIGYLWNGSAWERIEFLDIPESIYDANLLIRIPDRYIRLMTLDQKNSKSMNNSIELPKRLKRIDPTIRFFN